MPHQVIIIGSGFSGICVGIKLLEAGITDFKILEKSSELGGTWRENTYPGAECDVPSALYSYSFEHNPEWAYKWSGQQQILDYQRHTARKYGLTDHFVFGRTVASMRFDDGKSLWTIDTCEGEQFTTRHVISAVGQLHVPNTPQLKGEFKGDAFHSAQWNHQVDLTGKKVAVVGSAASALQLIPEVAKIAQQVFVLQRSPNWVLPKQDRPYAKWEQWLSDRVPMITKLYRFGLWFKGEFLLFNAINGNRFTQWLLGVWSKSYLKKTITDEALRAKLTPDYPVGAKRILFSDNYYTALARDNVELLTEPIESLTANGIRCVGRDDIEVDVIVYATGFVTNPFLSQIEVIGVDGRPLADHWKAGAQAYLGLSTHGFPNLHFMYGPNTNLGHNSILVMLEAQAKAIVKLVKPNRVEVKHEVETAYNEEIQQRLSAMAFSSIGESWYQVDGRVTNNWAGRTIEYRRRLRKLSLDAYQTQS